jgi:hypothetical protein
METSVTFVKTRYVYDSYADWHRLVELSGFPTIFVDELDVSRPGVYIISPMNGEWRPHIDNQASKPRNAHLILWNIERPSGSAGSVGQYADANHELIEKRYVDEVWVSDRRLAEETWLRFVVLGSHPGLGEPGKHKKHNFCHMSYLVPRRENILKHFPESTIGPNCWGAARDLVLRESKFALNIHQDSHPFQEPLRFALFAAYGLPIVTETIYDSYPWSDEFMVYASYPSLARQMTEVLTSDYEPYRLMGLRARERMCNEFGFGKMVWEAVTQSVGRSWR